MSSRAATHSGEVACPVHRRHLGPVDQLESGDLERAMPGDLPFLVDQDLLQGVDGESGLLGVERGGVGLPQERTYVRIHGVNIRNGCDRFKGLVARNRRFLEKVPCTRSSGRR
jgi:hypothetical protein